MEVTIVYRIWPVREFKSLHADVCKVKSVKTVSAGLTIRQSRQLPTGPAPLGAPQPWAAKKINTCKIRGAGVVGDNDSRNN